MPIRFSVIVPVYNTEKYLEKCIGSVLKQTCPNFELILIDDGSTDTSGRICDEYAASDSRIQAFHQPNQGQALSRRKGISAAKGDYLLFLDADDYWDADLLETIENAINAYHCDMVIFRYRKVSDNGDFLSESDKLFEDHTIFTCENRAPLYKALVQGVLNNLWSKSIRRTVIDSDDVTQYSDIRIGEDFLQVLPCVANSKSILYLDRVLYNYRDNPSSVSYQYNYKVFSDYLFFRGVLLEYMARWGIDTPEYLRIFYNHYIKYLLDFLFSITSLTYAERKKRMEEIQSSNFYRQALIYYNRQQFSFSQNVRFSLFKKRRYLFLWCIQLLIYAKLKLKKLFTKTSPPKY
ncbi:glycosyltransferase family 2 protein [Acetanaerobacterium elongatum]|uniref:Glycosyltransferase involved in cell wall bisynthesis n=1 Tax=Acetanaerobacterium elongatum TaxID=258515 RepID=A0A1G9Z521_9FIRM|nr:glycosyltransferase family 2 protein [Acetanaerobacterium elongatum]SDN16065.1 Glycosyltransferase involved in cell wall bisynthesis [Acetanaerobacterium elongatum]